jgi:methylated-DNA-[protein]-cysteine S-methyltransferase
MTEELPERPLLDYLTTPIGEALIVTDEAGFLRALDWFDCEMRMRHLLRRQYGALAPQPGAAPRATGDALRRYFAGDIHALTAIPWRTAGTPFQRAVWRALTEIPQGETISYGALAAKLGRPAAIRATGLANGSNPISVVVPCHRVIGSDGSLAGYGGGLARKRWLLQHEGARFRERAVASGRSIFVGYPAAAKIDGRSGGGRPADDTDRGRHGAVALARRGG